MTKQNSRVLEDQGTDLALRCALADAALEYANALYASMLETGRDTVRVIEHRALADTCYSIMLESNI